MSLNLASTEWASERGKKWAAQLSGMEATLAPVDLPLIEALALHSPSRIADIGCGGGGTTLKIYGKAPSGSSVHGFDISETLVNLARSRRDGESTLQFELADVSKAAPQERYDRLVSRFGIMFFDDPPAAFANLSRWLLPDSRFAFAVWDSPSKNQWIYMLQEISAELIDLAMPPPDAPGPFRYADSSKLTDLLEGSGFADIELSRWQGTLPIGGNLAPDEAAGFALCAFATFGEQLAKAGEDVYRQARELLTERFKRHYFSGAVNLGACVHIVSGRSCLSK